MTVEMSPSLRHTFAAAHHVALLDARDPAGVDHYLIGQQLATAAELPAQVDRAGPGNMNLTLRVRLVGRSLILKQGRPWVEKYDHIAAPWERTLVEGAFYRLVANYPDVAGRMPALIAVDAVNHVLALEDLGEGGDCSSIYTDGGLSSHDLDTLLAWLADLARVRIPPATREVFANRAMRALNHEHIFHVPLVEGNGLDLEQVTAGLGTAAAALKADQDYCRLVTAVGEIYLSDRASLVHGDFFPGSWIRAGGGLRVIDPEFCFAGVREFDYGVMLGHLALARTTAPLAARVVAACAAQGLDTALAIRVAGVEIMRRLIGVAQLPLTCGLDVKRRLLDLSRELVLSSERGLRCWI